MAKMSVLLVLFVLIIFIIHQSSTATHDTPIICLKLNNFLQNPIPYKIECKLPNQRIFIAQARFENDYDDYCYNRLTLNTSTNSTANIADNRNNGEFQNINCIAIHNQKLRADCNGKNNCEIKLSEADVTFREDVSTYQSNCEFIAQRLTVSYECIDVDYKANGVLDICKANSLDGAKDGFISSPNYPKNYNGRQYCQLKIKTDTVRNDRLEIYLIDLHLEKPSMWTANPTDYLQINNGEKLFGEKANEVIFNETNDALLVLKTDNFFTHRGFLIYFKVVKYKKASIITKLTISPIVKPTKIRTTTVIAGELNELSNGGIKKSKPNSKSNLLSNVSSANMIEEQLNATITTTTGANITLLSEMLARENLLASKSKSFFDDTTKMVAMLLLAVMCVICGILIGILIVYKNRRRNNRMKQSNDTLTSPSAILKVKRESEVIFVPYADDSVAHLLLNSSATAPPPPPTIKVAPPNIQNEQYEDITQLTNHEEAKLRFLEKQNIYIDDPINKNEYCYIHNIDALTLEIESNKPRTSAAVIALNKLSIPPPALPTTAPPSTATTSLASNCSSVSSESGSEITPKSSDNMSDTPLLNRKFPDNLPTSTPNTDENKTVCKSLNDDDTIKPGRLELDAENANELSYYQVPLNNSQVNSNI